MTAGRSTMVQLLGMLPAAGRGLTAITATATVVTALLPLVLMQVVGVLVGSVPRLLADDRPALWMLLAAVGVLLAVQQLAGLLLAGLSERLGRRLNLVLRTRVMKAMTEPVGLAHLDDARVQELRLGAQGLRGGYAGVMGSVVGLTHNGGLLLTAAGCAVTIVWISPMLGAILLVSHVAVGTLARRRFRESVSLLHLDPARQRRSAYFRDLALAGGADKELRVFGLAGWVIDRFDSTWFAVMRSAWRDRRRSHPVLFAAYVALGVVYAGAAYWLVRAGTDHVMGVSTIAVAIQAILGLMTLATVSQWDELMQAGRDASAAVVALERRIGEFPARAAAPVVPATGGDLVFDNVRFAYRAGSRAVLKGVDLVIPEGRATAIVGRNGCGKSTLLKLLLRFYEPDSGRVCRGPVALSALDPVAWRTRCAVVFQDYLRMAVSLRDAVEFGAWDRRGGQQALDLAAERAGLSQVLAELPDGWDTVLSPRFAGGVDLSGGQWQKVAIARALYALDRGAEILIMDEPTASLDAEAEQAVYESIIEAAAGRTSILVSHRFSSVRKADHIHVLDDGVIAEHGSHPELMARGGSYARMFDKQAELLR
ncbi:ABC transporter ATP-binding protein [Kutzneria kofuensis]|uniref:ATP-binding cassette subfamily B protein n=1 Tax=Kutzneria kofuensis TaxID=103725 RepID=A0A7W9KP58_9PSEU|nr:ABC transporter ATP-binding protein [Kutzneria kofuensis]MBB5896080.1 ATP-binding cassette subfamily B protein [Kutzneria kofuensis]